MSNNMTQKRIIMAMSGGVDSSVAAYLLNQQLDPSLYTLHGLHMNNWNTADEEQHGGSSSYCVASEQDAKDAQQVCRDMGMNLHRVSFAAEYWTRVFEPFLEGIQEGRTINPDSEFLIYIICTTSSSSLLYSHHYSHNNIVIIHIIIHIINNMVHSFPCLCPNYRQLYNFTQLGVIP